MTTHDDDVTTINTDNDFIDVIRRAIRDEVAPVERRLIALERNVDLLIEEVRQSHQRVTRLEDRRARKTLTPIPRSYPVSER